MEISMSIMLSEYYLFLQGSHMLKHIADKNYKYTIEKSDILIRDIETIPIKNLHISIINNHQNIKFPCNFM